MTSLSIRFACKFLIYYMPCSYGDDGEANYDVECSPLAHGLLDWLVESKLLKNNFCWIIVQYKNALTMTIQILTHNAYSLLTYKHLFVCTINLHCCPKTHKSTSARRTSHFSAIWSHLDIPVECCGFKDGGTIYDANKQGNPSSQLI